MTSLKGFQFVRARHGSVPAGPHWAVRTQIMLPVRSNLFRLICLIQPASIKLFMTSVLGFFPDRVSGVHPHGGKARFREQQSLLLEPLSTVHQPVL